MKENYQHYLSDVPETKFTFKQNDKDISGTYMDFSARKKPLPLETPRDALAIAFYFSRKAINAMDAIMCKAKEPQKKKIQGARDWLYKKAIYHTHDVRKEMEGMVLPNSFIHQATEAGLVNNQDLLNKMRIIAITHDIGRFCEININDGTKFDLQNVKEHDHSVESYEILKSLGVTDPLVLLPVKYHGVKELDIELQKSEEYLQLSDEQKKKVNFLSHTIRDADKIANLETYTITGVKKCGEMNNPNYHGKFEISAPVLKAFYNGETVPNKETHTYLDTMLKFSSWLYDIHFDFNKKRAVDHILNPLFDRIYEQARDEWNEEGKNKTMTKEDALRYNKTIGTLQKAQEFITKQLGGKMNRKSSERAFNGLTPDLSTKKNINFNQQSVLTYVFGRGIR